MTIKIKKDSWKEELIIDTPKGDARVWIKNDEIVISNEEILSEFGLSVGDAIALFFDKAADSYTRQKYTSYLSRNK